MPAMSIAAVRVAACLASVALGVAGMAGIDAPGGAAQPVAGAPVATLTEQGLFPVEPPFLPTGPAIALYADGTVFAPDRALPTVAPQVWPYRTGRVEPAAVEAVLSRARALDLLRDRGAYPPMDVRAIGAISHPPQTIVVLSTAGRTLRHVADGLSASDTDSRRIALRRFSGELKALAEHARDRHEPTRIAVVAAPVAAEASRRQADWPGTDVDLSKLTACTTIDNEAIIRFLRQQAAGTLYRQGGRHYRLAARVVLPGGSC